MPICFSKVLHISIFTRAICKEVLQIGKENILLYLFWNHIIEHVEGLVTEGLAAVLFKRLSDPLQRLVLLFREVKRTEKLLERAVCEMILARLMVEQAEVVEHIR